jgi:hypothetical protein
MAKTATYEGPWDSHKFSKKDLDADKAYEFKRGVPVQITDDLVEKLEATGNKFSFGDAKDSDEADGNADGNLTDENGGGEADQTGLAVSDSSKSSGSGRTRSTRSTR